MNDTDPATAARPDWENHFNDSLRLRFAVQRASLLSVACGPTAAASTPIPAGPSRTWRAVFVSSASISSGTRLVVTARSCGEKRCGRPRGLAFYIPPARRGKLDIHQTRRKRNYNLKTQGYSGFLENNPPAVTAHADTSRLCCGSLPVVFLRWVRGGPGAILRSVRDRKKPSHLPYLYSGARVRVCRVRLRVAAASAALEDDQTRGITSGSEATAKFYVAAHWLDSPVLHYTSRPVNRKASLLQISHVEQDDPGADEDAATDGGTRARLSWTFKGINALREPKEDLLAKL
ncbi:uncharacterized protein LOC114854808 [Betta splendens]|uniref:Uncharacterized protein LOC114854808 n=1 Tax=Betta splendens TaxID=158456 RepID=A0A8M1HE82_BETSP|nr:uncharacterized protein LOC114854808 [Betta splendens]